jgi:hypothetical protein
MAFHDARPVSGDGKLRKEPLKETKHFAAHLKDGRRYEVEHGGDLAFRYVDREIFPLRSTEEDGPRPDVRWLDLLLVGDGGRPIVGELKIGGDSLAPLALVQALMYAAELSSQSQLKRLAKHYPEATPPFIAEVEGPRLDILVISFEAVEGTNRKRGLELAVRLRDLLMADGEGRVSKVIGRIEFVDAILGSDGLTFSLHQDNRHGP